MSGTAAIIVLAIIAGGYMLVRRASTFKAGMATALCVLVLLGLVIGSQS